ncbi:hypothetical protein N866_14690 [Actinotalea ferrariae CF5-4]|uniref:Transposase n=1 Tax=Actinotalea ferrariae CF5-4 TaxID=948458 RepID=A0A021VL53_9CELL|nr:hypothetical protein [Actinotalea ferrariae]EYR61881.1 hypothetical protein N866_14690 [Actinotalea ferrariae CF5-4]
MLPLGTSVYKTTKDHDVVNSVVAHYGQPNGVDCPHDLWVDDGALFDVIEYGPARHQFKRARAQAVASRRIKTPSGFAVWTTWLLPCTLQPSGHLFDTETRPRVHRASPGGAERKKAEGQLRPVARMDTAAFQSTYGLRNITESVNSWFKKLLANNNTGGRAMRLNVQAQAVDHLCAMFVLNAITYERYRRSTRQ